MTESREPATAAEIGDEPSSLHTGPFRLTLAEAPGQGRRARIWARVRRYVSCLRFEEIVLLQGPPILGAAFALGDLSMEFARPMLILTIGNLALMAHVFLLNDWSGLSDDLEDPNKAAEVFVARGVDHREVGWICAALLIASLVAFSSLGNDSLILAAAIAALSALYSLPRFNWKGRPILNSVVHLAGGILHFLLGYSLWSAVDERGISIALFFALTFVAGHLTQEVRDHEGDLMNGTRTNAVAFGSSRVFRAALLIFTLAYTVLILAALRGFLPAPLAALGFLYPIHLIWSVRTLRRGLGYANIVPLQRRYRALYAVIGSAMITALAAGI